MQTVEFPAHEAIHAYPRSSRLNPFDPDLLARQQVDTHYLVVQGGGSLAQASLWWREVPAMAGERLGVIGHFAACDEAAARILLSRCLQRLQAEGVSLAVGPMDGNTWRRYRFVSEPGEEPSFFLEPENPSVYPAYFLAAGFTPLAEYSSARVSDLTNRHERIPRAIARLKGAGIAWRPLDKRRFEEELRAIYRLSLESFTHNFLYTPIGEEAFLEQYRLIAPHVEPELTLMAEQDGELLGYLFGIPDLNQTRRGEELDTFIVKTVAVLPQRRAAGLGSVLVAESQRIAHELGYRRAIHALMHDANSSRNISAHYARTMRRYTLYQQKLGPMG
jgi:GNAT superfamily N-acetyltransferase